MIVIGVDGANVQTLVEPAQRGTLPNLGAVLEDGTGGILRSRTTSSAAAWTAHLTGVGPERGGITGFTIDDRFVRTDDISVRTYPEILDSAGIKIGLLNIPLTYPPLRLEQGFCVPGQLTPLDAETYTDSDHIQATLDDVDYEVDIQYGDRQYAFVDDDLDVTREDILQDVKRVESKRLMAARQLLREESWDLFFVLVNGTDPMQHFWWHEIADGRLEDTSMLPVYELIDEFVGDIYQDYPNENIMLFSDHGFREDVWGSTDTTRRRWRRVRSLASTAFPERLKQTKLRQWGMDLLAAGAKATTSDTSADEHTGSHDPAGVWMLGGPDVSNTTDTNFDFMDLPPTILHLMNHAVLMPTKERYLRISSTLSGPLSGVR